MTFMVTNSLTERDSNSEREREWKVLLRQEFAGFRCYTSAT